MLAPCRRILLGDPSVTSLVALQLGYTRLVQARPKQRANCETLERWYWEKIWLLRTGVEPTTSPSDYWCGCECECALNQPPPLRLFRANERN